MRGGVRDVDFYFKMGLALSAADEWPEWKAGCEFKASRDAMMASAGK